MPTKTISVNLPVSVVYVSGTVNGVTYAWTQSGTTWSAIADKSENAIYLVELTTIDSLGRTGNYSLTLFYGLLNLITDRTNADIEEKNQIIKKIDEGGFDSLSADEKSAFLSGLRGAYNATDLNRVGAALNYVKARLNSAGFNFTWTANELWQISDIPTPAQMTQYLGYVSDLRSAITVPDNTPDVPTDMVNLTHTEANNIEKILLQVDALVTLMLTMYVYSGEVYCGEVN